ncbi:LutB/LldF family L-lactate oxidation iron-sulfur protein [Novibacillus thermophilus]|uniref:Iron-sulfur cluster-binding protein n=1 Tax=Novibacillus thermophilus TaxID=1471761 RepID=A0A1U9K811_9BACL|nr:LutB/LldF family L-lactate oxidation iron-sulfur protein [Novibacillus thermophilus]AQS56160.1 iron-sulfur cluster-binding protein [Novibacillus thermophilus]
MSDETTAATLRERASQALSDDFLRQAVKFTTDRLRGKKRESTEAFGRWEEWRERGRQIRAHTIAYLDYYLDQFTRNVEALGGHVHFAQDAAEAREIALRIAQEKQAKLTVKSKSMVSEELHINDHFEAHGIECLETDLGEWIVQLADETPSHIIIPAIHKNRYQIKDLFERQGGETLSEETEVLAGFARRTLRQKFQQAEIGMTGCNFAIAESGSIVIFSNEGNARMVTTLPKTHIVTMGMERILPSWDDLEVMANLLPRSATGQKLTVYMSVLSGTRREGEIDGPEDLHVIILDNGRSHQLGDPEFQEVLHCIRCGACLNVCPVYRQVGGHTYNSPYSGPIGAVLTPLLRQDDGQAEELPYASSLCGACYDACPVKIPLHDMLVHLRRRKVEKGETSKGEQLAFRLYGKAFSSASTYSAGGKVARKLQRATVGDGSRMEWARPFTGPLQGWTDHRHLPEPPARSFRDIWAELEKEGSDVSEDRVKDLHGKDAGDARES